eukprot:403348182
MKISNILYQFAIFIQIFNSLTQAGILSEQDFSQSTLVSLYPDIDFDSQDFCIIKGDFVALISCQNSKQSFIVDTYSLVNPKTQYNSTTKLNEGVFKYKQVTDQNSILFSNIEQVLTKKGALTVVYSNSTIQRQKSKGFFYDAAGNDTSTDEFTYSTFAQILSVYYDARIIITKNYNGDHGYFIELSSFNIKATMDFYRYTPQALQVFYELYREQWDSYSLYIGLQRSNQTQIQLFSISSMQVGLYNPKNYTLNDMCIDNLFVTEVLLVVVCESKRKFQVFRRTSSSLIIMAEVNLAQNLTFSNFKLNQNLRSDYFFVISRQAHNYIFYQSTNLTTTTRIFNTTLSNGTVIEESVTDTKINYQLYVMEFLLSPISKILDNYLLKTNLKLSQFYTFMQQSEKLQFICRNAMQSISDQRNYYIDTFSNKNNLLNNGNSSQNVTDNTPVIDISYSQEDSKLTNWTIALLVVVISTSTCSIVTVIVFIIRKRMQQNRRAVGPEDNSVNNNLQSNNDGPNDINNTDEENMTHEQRERRRQARDNLRKQKIDKIKSLAPKKKYMLVKNNEFHQSSCGICFEDYQPNDQVRETQCRHLFHSQCIMQWALNQLYKNSDEILDPDCPYCKSSLLILIERKANDKGIDKSLESQRLQLSQQFQLGIDTDRNHLQNAVSMHTSQNPNTNFENHATLNLEEVTENVSSPISRPRLQNQLQRQSQAPQINNLVGQILQQDSGSIIQQFRSDLEDDASSVIERQLTRNRRTPDQLTDGRNSQLMQSAVNLNPLINIGNHTISSPILNSLLNQNINNQVIDLRLSQTNHLIHQLSDINNSQQIPLRMSTTLNVSINQNLQEQLSTPQILCLEGLQNNLNSNDQNDEIRY